MAKKLVATNEERPSVDWYDLLEQAVSEPGELEAAYKYFRKYSLANRWLASTQLRAAGIGLAPINTFKGWLDANRPVKKGEKAMVSLNMPVSVRGKKKDEGEDEDKSTGFTMFMLRRHWFHLDQTEGEEFKPEEAEVGDWNLNAALAQLEIQDVPFVFASVSDTRSTYSSGREISVSSLAEHQLFQRLREMARIQLGHNDVVRGKNVPADVHLLEIEVETAAYLAAATLNIPGVELARQKVQENLDDCALRRIPPKSAKRAFSAADQLINAGYC